MIVVMSMVLLATAAAHGPNCCSKVSGSCRSACEKLYHDTISDLETKHQRHLDVTNFCPHHLIAFWKCMNQTEDELDDERSWSVCCEGAETEKCRIGCKTAVKSSELPQYCRKSDELALYSCVEKQEFGEECCGLARSPDCHELCRRWLKEPGKVPWSTLLVSCTAPVQNCLNNMSKPFFLTTPQKYLHCCDHASTSICKDTCRRNLKKRIYDMEIMSNIQDACGSLVLHEGEIRLALCLLQTEPAELQRSPHFGGFNEASLHCCYKASGNMCRSACFKLFSGKGSASLKEYEMHCQKPVEENLLQCSDEVTEPCELGCQGLSYCSEYNNIPNELFRACSAGPDKAAEDDVEHVKKTNQLELPNKQRINVKHFSHCTEVIKLIACANQIKPCDRFTQTTRICYSECMAAINGCVELTDPEANRSANAICEHLAPFNQNSTGCIRFPPFKNNIPELTGQITSPCRFPESDRPRCRPNEICKVNKSCNTDQENCQPYKCQSGCVLSKSQSTIIPERSYGRTPSLENGKQICHKICQCGMGGILKHCVDYCRRVGALGCKGKAHSSSFYRGCNLCSCNYGETVCSKKLCTVKSNITTDEMMSTFPCNCPPHYLPVCAWNGVTYPNPCLAKCSAGKGVNYASKPCSAIDPCNESVRCQRESDICLPKRRVCLAELHTNCSQHICVSTRTNCANQPYEPVCDTEGITHSNPCALLKAKKNLAYFGPCLANCENEGEVCGVDGNTYPSECTAHARYISVDYLGPCTSLGNVHISPQVQCQDVKCPPLQGSECMAYTPPGACCPVCAGAVIALFSQKEIDTILLTMNGQGMEQFTVEAIMSTLEQELLTAECSIRGHLTIEDDLLILVVPSKKESTSLVREACVREAEKIGVLIQRFSPRIVVPLSTSVLIASRMVHQPAPQDPDSSSILIPIPLLIMLLVIVNLFSCYF